MTFFGQWNVCRSYNMLVLSQDFEGLTFPLSCASVIAMRRAFQRKSLSPPQPEPWFEYVWGHSEPNYLPKAELSQPTPQSRPIQPGSAWTRRFSVPRKTHEHKNKSVLRSALEFRGGWPRSIIVAIAALRAKRVGLLPTTRCFLP